MNISGRVPVSSEVVIEIVGPVVTAQYDIKGRVGPFWMSRQKVHLENVPSLYGLLTPAGGNWAEELSGLNLGFETLKTGIEVSQTEQSRDEILKMFMDLKKSEGLYSENFGAVTYDAEKDGFKTFHGVYDFPSSTATGKYTIKASMIENGAAAGEYVKEFPVRETGFVKIINELATNRRLVYGIMAVVIALITGGVMGLLFKGGGSH